MGANVIFVANLGFFIPSWMACWDAKTDSRGGDSLLVGGKEMD